MELQIVIVPVRVGGLLPTSGITLTTSYPYLTVDNPINIEIKYGKPYEKQGAIIYIKSYSEFVLLNNTLPTGITFKIENSIFVIRAINGKRGMYVRFLSF